MPRYPVSDGSIRTDFDLDGNSPATLAAAATATAKVIFDCVIRPLAAIAAVAFWIAVLLLCIAFWVVTFTYVHSVWKHERPPHLIPRFVSESAWPWVADEAMPWVESGWDVFWNIEPTAITADEPPQNMLSLPPDLI